MQRISIVVPVFNAGKTLRQCVDSILSLEYKDFELLLIDDGSIDNSPDICDEYARSDERVRVWHKSNGGVSSARNLGLDNARGEWIVFVDSDDYLSHNYLNGLNTCKADLALMQYSLFWKDGRTEVVNHIKNLPEEFCGKEVKNVLNRYLTAMMFRSPTAMAFRRDLIGDIRFNELMKVGEDTQFVHRYLVNINSVKCYYYYYVGVGSESADIKYSCTVDYAVNSLQFLKDSFMLLEQKWGLSRRLYFSYIGYFKLISKREWKRKVSLWYGNTEIKELYDYVWPQLNWIMKLRIFSARVLKR